MALPLQVPVGSVQLAETLVYVPVVPAYPDQFVLSAWWRMPPRAFGTAEADPASWIGPPGLNAHGAGGRAARGGDGQAGHQGQQAQEDAPSS